jgi:predicted DNA-binding ribbon-helix-helix protein
MEAVQAYGTPKRRRSTLINRNVYVTGRRTSVRLESAMWDALAEICEREGISIHELCNRVEERRRESSLTAAMRVFVVSYFRAAATENGHADAGHGTRRPRPSERPRLQHA